MESKARDLPDLLRELAGWKRRADGGLPLVVPVVTLWLRSGARATGFVAEVRDAERGRDVPMVLLLQLPDDPHRKPSDAIHVPLGSVEAVTVHDFEQAGQARPDAPGPRSKLELMRLLGPIEEALRAAGIAVRLVVPPDGLDGPDGARAIAALGALANVAREALLKVAAPGDGKAALQAVSEIKLALGGARAARDGTTLVLSTPGEIAGWPTAEELAVQIEAAL